MNAVYTKSDVQEPHAKKAEAAIVFYDGMCVLCSRVVRFLMHIDRRRTLKFASLQGETANMYLREWPHQRAEDWSVVFLCSNGGPSRQTYLRSTAILKIFEVLGGFWVIISWFRFIPAPVRDRIYVWVARNRYSWFGKYDACPVLPSEERDRVLP